MEEINGEKKNGLMLVGIGASAGGVDALLRFLEKMPANSGLAFAVLLHMPPHDSRLAEVLQTKTKMPVTQVAEVVRVERDHVYCLPPDRQAVISSGYLRLGRPEVVEGGHLTAPIDLFFRALAHSYRDRAVAVVLSGAGADGSPGLGLLREERSEEAT